MENNLNELQIDYSFNDENIVFSLNEISYKMDSLVFRQEEQTGAISQGFGILIVFIVIFIIFSFIKSFIDF